MNEYSGGSDTYRDIIGPGLSYLIHTCVATSTDCKHLNQSFENASFGLMPLLKLAQACKSRETKSMQPFGSVVPNSSKLGVVAGRVALVVMVVDVTSNGASNESNNLSNNESRSAGKGPSGAGEPTNILLISKQRF